MKTRVFRVVSVLICLALIRCSSIGAPADGLDSERFPGHEDDTLTPTLTVTITPTPTATRPPTVFFDAMNGKGDCFTGASQVYQKVASLNQFEIVNILGKNDNKGDWVLIRWRNIDCWIEAGFLPKYHEYKELLQLVPTPLPPTAVVTGPTKTRKPSDGSNSGGETAQAQSAQGQTAQAAQGQTAQAAQAQTAQAAQGQTAQAAQAQTAQAAQAQTSQAAQAQTAQAAQALTARAIQQLTSQALTNQAANSHKKQCNDGIDNDSDGNTDHPADDGCDNPGDDSE